VATIQFPGAGVTNPVMFIGVPLGAIKHGSGLFEFLNAQALCNQGGGILTGNAFLVDGSGSEVFLSRRLFPSRFFGAAIALAGTYTSFSINYLPIATQMVIAIGKES